jgi:hypothetical protein
LDRLDLGIPKRLNVQGRQRGDASAYGRQRWVPSNPGQPFRQGLGPVDISTEQATAARLGRRGWEPIVEASFSIWGERGSIDILAWHAGSRTLLVIEVKSIIPDLQATLHDLDRKARLAPDIASRRGWETLAVGRLLVVAESPTSRGRVRRSGGVLDVALPARGPAVRAWLREPRGPIAGTWFLSNAAHAHTKRPLWRRERVRVAGRPAKARTPAMDNESRLAACSSRGKSP